jgi:hypothetical protein
MEQNVRKNDAPLSFAEILTMLRKKLVLIICITLAVAILAASATTVYIFAFGSFGTEVSFYITPVDSSQSLLSLLKSESFSEKLLLDENGLPPREECNAADYDAALAAIVAENAARDRKQKARDVLDMIPYSFALVQERYNELSKTYSETYNLLTTYKSAYVGDHETHAEKIKEYEQKLADASAAKRAYEESTYNPALQSKLEAEKEMAESSVELKEARERSEELVEKVLRPWRENEDVQRKISLIQNGVSFEYEKIVSKTNSTTTENDNYSFLTVSIAISDDEEFVAEIAEKVKQNTPLFVEKTIERLTGLAEANCVIISPYSNVSNLDANGFVVTTARVSAVAGFLALAGTCFIVILSHMTKAYLASTPKDEDESLPENAQK